MLPGVLEVCPSFSGQWLEFLEEWEAEGEELPLYLALGELARHLIEMLERGETDALRQVFGVVERWHLEGAPYVKEAATVGLLEDLQNESLHHSTKPEQFRPLLGPESTRWWDELYAFWERVSR